MRYQRAELPLRIEGLASAREFFAGCLADSNPERESLFVAHLDGDSRCVHLSWHDGDETGTEFPLRQIVADAAVHGSAGIVLAHNHPSGDPAPSASDMRSTRRLAAATEAMDCTVLDHLIFAGTYCSSLRQLGYL
jgi:DNA repair protein RadC